MERRSSACTAPRSGQAPAVRFGWTSIVSSRPGAPESLRGETFRPRRETRERSWHTVPASKHSRSLGPRPGVRVRRRGRSCERRPRTVGRVARAAAVRPLRRGHRGSPARRGLPFFAAGGLPLCSASFAGLGLSPSVPSVRLSLRCFLSLCSPLPLSAPLCAFALVRLARKAGPRARSTRRPARHGAFAGWRAGLARGAARPGASSPRGCASPPRPAQPRVCGFARFRVPLRASAVARPPRRPFEPVRRSASATG